MRETGIFSLMVAMLCSGCITQHVQRNMMETLDSRRTVYVAVPEDGQYGEIKYVGSGMQAATSLAAQARDRFAGVQMGMQVQTLAEADAAAREAKTGYLFYLKIIHWEDRATEWSGLQDRLEILISVMDMSTGKAVDVSSLTAKTKAFTWAHAPEDFLPKLFGEYCDRLIGSN